MNLGAGASGRRRGGHAPAQPGKTGTEGPAQPARTGRADTAGSMRIILPRLCGAATVCVAGPELPPGVDPWSRVSASSTVQCA